MRHNHPNSTLVNPTFVGVFAVLVWGLSLPFVKYVQMQIGIFGYPATVFTAMGTVGAIHQYLIKKNFPDKKVFRNPYLYARWFLFVVNLVGVWTAVALVQRQFVPFVILLNYLWPTFIILGSIALAGVTVTRRFVFAAGTLIVVTAIAIEVLNTDVLTSELFALPQDRMAYGFAVLGSFCWGMYAAVSRRAGHEAGGSTVLPIFQLSMGLGALPFALIPGWVSWDHITPHLAGVMVGWCVLNFLAYVTWDFGIRRGNIVLLSLFADFTPWLSLFASHLILGVAIGEKTILSAICLVAGATTTRYGTLAKKANKRTATQEELTLVQPPAD